MRARQHSRLAPDRTNLVKRAAVRTSASFKHFIAENAFLEEFKDFVRLVLLFLAGLFNDLVVQRVDLSVAFELVVLLRVESIDQLCPDLFVDRSHQLRIEFFGDELLLALASSRNQLLQNFDDLETGLVPVFQGAEHFLFGNLLGPRFDHHDSLLTARHDHVEL